MAKIIVAYDGTPHAEDALALAQRLGELTGAPPALAYVHRADPQNPSPSATVRGREAFLRRENERLLRQAAERIGAPGLTCYALPGTTTATALRELAQSERPQMIVFGSAYNGPVARVHPGSAARRLLQGGSCPIAFAPASLADHPPATILTVSIAHDDAEGSARSSAEALAARTGASVDERPGEQTDLLVVSSRPTAPAGQVMTSAVSERTIHGSRAAVIVLPRGTALRLDSVRAHAA